MLDMGNKKLLDFKLSSALAKTFNSWNEGFAYVIPILHILPFFKKDEAYENFDNKLQDFEKQENRSNTLHVPLINT